MKIEHNWKIMTVTEENHCQSYILCWNKNVSISLLALEKSQKHC